MKYGMLRPFPSTKGGAPSGPGTAYRHWSRYACPGHFLDDDCLTTAAIDATHGIKQKDQKAPSRNELETALGELIVSGGRLMATRTNRRRTFARTHRDLNTLVIGAETGLLVNESRKTVTTV